MDITKDIRPLTEFKRDTAAFTKRLRETQEPAIPPKKGTVPFFPDCCHGALTRRPKRFSVYSISLAC